MFQRREAGNQDPLSAHLVDEKGQGPNFKGNHYLFSKTCSLLDFSKALLSPSVSSLYAAMRIWQPHVLGRRLWTRFTYLACGHQGNEEKLHFGLDPVAHEPTTGSAFLLREIKHHIKTQYIWGRKDKNTKSAWLIFRNAILSFVKFWHSASQITKLI